ncbi:MAG: class I SAM-dependent RNA methyltransferase [Erythrobacter sp.]
MTDPQTIVRIAARGDGITADGQHVSGAAPDDIVLPDGTLQHGPNHATPPCRHFGTCGGCDLQHLNDAALAGFVTDRVRNAAEGQSIDIGELLPTHLSPAHSRRRATLHGMAIKSGTLLGFKRRGSHQLVNLKQCDILDPKLFALVKPLRRFIGSYGGKGVVDIALSLADQGVDCSLKNITLEGLEATEAALELAQSTGVARLTLDQGYGPETVWEPEPLTQTLSGVPVSYPSGAFLQASPDAEARMVADAQDWLGDAKMLADLFSGLGTFAFALADPAKVLAAEAERASHLACKGAANMRGVPVHTLHRDLFRNPLQPSELDKFDGILLDPPRAGAREQIDQIAQSQLSRVVYISCNPSSWAKDAKRLVEAGFTLQKLRPVGQFRWSTHVELTSFFTR